ncbi:UDP-Glycosyltransferase superfamily protein [Euphorbia peplus]|nr:UDP-Glycosyltransferase superfamily protein [Euphorbia peplus]
MEKDGLKRRRLVIVSCPFQGHINPTLELATILHSNGFSITIVHTEFNSPNQSLHPEFDFKALSHVNIDDILATGNILDLVLGLNERCASPLEECLIQMMEEKDCHGEIACLIYDDFMYFSADVANRLPLPSIVFRTSSVVGFLARLVILRLNSQGRIPFLDSISEEPVPELSSLKFKDLQIFKSETRPGDFYTLLTNACDLKTSSAVIWNTIDCLEDSLLAKQKETQSPNPIFTIGPMHKLAPSSSSNSLIKEDTTCISWLDKQAKNSVLYISMGSVVSINEQEIGEMAWVLSNTNQPFLWVIRPGSITGCEWIELLPEGFIENVGERGRIVKWAPQKEVLAHCAVGGFWTHCGWNSTLESVAEGVTMICNPCFGDQPITARYVSDVWGIGVIVDKFDRYEMEKCVRRVMGDEEGKEMRKKALILKEEVEMCIKKGGSSSNSLNNLVEFISSL